MCAVNVYDVCTTIEMMAGQQSMTVKISALTAWNML